MSELKVVIVDDAMFMRTVLKNLLLEENIEVIGEASNGLEAIEMAMEKKPDIMTLDITMPELDGISAIPRILEASPNTKIIMVSAMGQQGMVIDAIKKGAKDFITKPFEKSRVLQAIKKVMEL
ncbi:MAG TPA: two-component system response regulator [Clostridiales bacterium]|nr:MAG: two-component system response regulator [Clostridiales bacterium GWD2_32_19]HCC06860.1 two-component system response regulator [Clostridiales bacterium]